MSYHNTKGSLISITKCANHEWQSTEVQKNRKWNKAQWWNQNASITLDQQNQAQSYSE